MRDRISGTKLSKFEGCRKMTTECSRTETRKEYDKKNESNEKPGSSTSSEGSFGKKEI